MVNLAPYRIDNIALEVYEACARRVAAEPRREYLGMSIIGDPCERRLWLGYNNADKAALEGRIARVFDCGQATEARVITDLRAAGYTIDGQQTEFTDFDGRFGGHCDGVIHGVTKRPHILEIKSANDAAFKNFKKQGLKFKPVYEAQMQCYMGYGGQERGLFVVENKNTQELYTERVYFNQAQFEELKAKAQRIVEAVDPPAKSEDESGCRYCDFKDFGCIHPPVAKAAVAAEPGCQTCGHFVSAEAITNGTTEVVGTLRIIIAEILPPLPLDQQQTARKEMFDLLRQALAFRPDLTLPAKYFYQSSLPVIDQFKSILAYVLNDRYDWVLYGEDDKPLKGHFTPQPAARPWCGHHSQQIKQPVGCPQWVSQAAPF
jgi:hypothetical protein